MKKSLLIILTFLLFHFFIYCSPSQWVKSFGVQTGLGDEYLTGFGISPRDYSGSDAVEAAKILAMSDLIRKVSVEITTEMTDSYLGTENSDSSYFNSVTKSKGHLNLPGTEFKIEEEKGIVYSLAYLKKDSLIQDLQLRTGENILHALELYSSASDTAARGENIRAASLYAQVLPLLSKIYRDCSILQILSITAQTDLFQAYGSKEASSIDNLISLESEINNSITNLRNSNEKNLDQAMEKILFLLKEQGLRGGKLKNPALTFQQTDFSSPFGQYAANKLAHVLEEGLTRGGSETIIQGSYWLKDDSVEIFVQARDSRKGSVIGSASALFPASSLPGNMDLEPQNHVEALIDLLEFQEEALTDGSIHLEIWTDKGHNEDVLVYSRGEELQLYFRVNQPCFLQLSYFLATGEKVLLEEKFYIGIDKVNRVVALPYLFEVVPPLGVERLVVSAFSAEPTSPPVFPKEIDGEQFMVFGSMEKALSQTRGLRRTQSSDVRSGEAQLAITTLP